MPGCCVPLCTSATEKGHRCIRFPRDWERRKKWEIQVKRDCWKATDNSRICERHSDDDQFEGRRQDGRRVLKSNALPTLFDFRPAPTQRKKPAARLPLAGVKIQGNETTSPLHSTG
ncbi:peroxynitrite isomerase THAP4-like [Dermacentor variabilis]|uniref:peroxynitrite isomerase THAP4-like n=1 Tax=Dermacentor variabilis TaxID=34621 RepID=UPI003F5B5C2C